MTYKFNVTPNLKFFTFRSDANPVTFSQSPSSSSARPSDTMAARAAQALLLKGSRRSALKTSKQTCLSKKFQHPFTFEEAGVSSCGSSVSTCTISKASSLPQTHAVINKGSKISNKDGYLSNTMIKEKSSIFELAAKFRVPFDEGPSMTPDAAVLRPKFQLAAKFRVPFDEGPFTGEGL
jgi:hypothetical protein